MARSTVVKGSVISSVAAVGGKMGSSAWRQGPQSKVQKGNKPGTGAITAEWMLCHFEHMLRSISKLTGLNHCLHDLSGFTEINGQRNLCAQEYLHDNPFCNQIKLRRNRQCMMFDRFRMNQKMGVLRRPFVKKCYAGVIELVVPVLAGENHVGTIFIGPAREKERGAPRGSDVLPVRTRAELNDLSVLVMLLAGYIAQGAETLLVQRAAVQAQSAPVCRALMFAAKHYRQALTVETVACHVFLSPSRFAHLFSREVGVPFHEYLSALRIERAKALLRGSSLCMGEIAERTGFCNQNYFTTIFHRRTGATPSAFRRAQQKTIDV